MPSWLRIGLFMSVFTALVAVTHLYLCRRLARDPMRGRARRVGRWLIGGAAVVLVGGVVVNRLVPPAAGEVIAYLAFGWMGVVILLVPLLMGLDLLRWMTRLGGGGPEDPQRRLAMAQGVAALGVLGAGGGALAGVRGASAAPTLREVDLPIPHLPAALEGFRVVQLSDVHIGPTIGGDFLRAVVARVNALSPDLVAITGDLVDGSVPRLAEDVACLADLRSRHGTFFCTGNHEYYSGVDAWLAHLATLKVRVLRNERVRITHGGAALDVLGVDDWRAHGGGHGHDLAKAVAGRDARVPSLLLAHQPKAVDDAAARGVDAMICGHTHGGQIWPYGHLVRFLQPYTRGLHHHVGRTWIYVHQGTGYWGPPMRLGVASEIALLRLRRAGGSATQAAAQIGRGRLQQRPPAGPVQA